MRLTNTSGPDGIRAFCSLSEYRPQLCVMIVDGLSHICFNVFCKNNIFVHLRPLGNLAGPFDKLSKKCGLFCIL